MINNLLHPPLSPNSQVTEIFFRIVSSPLSQCKPKVTCIFPCLNYAFVIGCLTKESLRGERQLLPAYILREMMIERTTYHEILPRPCHILHAVNSSCVIRH